LVIPAEEIIKATVSVEGFKVPKPEILLILKQQAEMSREDKVKGQKDRVDILSLLMKGVDLDGYRKLLKKFAIENYFKHLKKLIAAADKEFEYLGITNPREKKKIKQKILSNFK
jgi:hypothetical protein